MLSTDSVLRVAIDPGVNGLGFSVYDGPTLVAGAYLTGLGGQVHPLLECVPAFEAALAELGQVDELVLEIPKVYETEHQSGDQRDIVRLALVCGALMCAARPYVRGILTVEPSTWKGNLDKAVCRDRTIAKLSQDELQRVDLPAATSIRHNVWDAVALGRWRAQRSTP